MIYFIFIDNVFWGPIDFYLKHFKVMLQYSCLTNNKIKNIFQIKCGI